MKYEAVRKMALALPGAEEGRSYGTAAIKVRGKMIARLKEDGETLVLKSTFEDRDMLTKMAPETFFFTDHYRDYPYVLVRLGKIRAPMLRDLLKDAMPTGPTVAQHFEGRDSAVRATYDRILKAARAFGPWAEDPKKTSIHLANGTAFAGIATRKSVLILTLKSKVDIRSKRVSRHEKASANRWHLEVRLESPAEVDAELVGWLRAAYELAG